MPAAALAARDPDRAREAVAGLASEVVPWEQRGRPGTTVFINATPVGMAPSPGESPFEPSGLPGLRAVVDLVANPLETTLIARARIAGVKVVPGYVVSLHQAAAQFRLYTGRGAPAAILEAALRSRFAVALAHEFRRRSNLSTFPPTIEHFP